jgi:hypothetical protein
MLFLAGVKANTGGGKASRNYRNSKKLHFRDFSNPVRRKHVDFCGLSAKLIEVMLDS